MKTTTTITLLMLSAFSYTQTSEYNNYTLAENVQSQYTPIKYQPTEHVEKITFTVLGKKNKERKFIKEYNEEGQLTHFSGTDKNGNMIPISTIEYDQNNKVIVSKHYKKGELKNSIYRTYTDNGKLKEIVNKDAKEHVVFRNIWEYTADDCLSKSIRFKKNGKIDKRWAYEYSDQCTKSKTTLYNGKGKVINTWSYACKEEGEKLEKRKNEAQVCKWEETTNNYLIKVYQTFNEKGKVRKNVSKYTLNDTLIVEHATMDDNDNLIHKSTYDKSYDKPLISTSFNKGKKTYERIYEYENDNVVFYSFTYKEKLKSKYEYTYERNLLAEQKAYNKKGEVFRTVKLTY
ncbi:MAG TPA: hypothetical protein VKY37_11415 [Brumimicrobium sp.]|nr:hypothetical protein [Brumimicrobium sp.]